MSSMLKQIFEKQKKLQNDMIHSGLYDNYVDYVTKNTLELPFDHPKVASYHIQQLISEIGEVLDADKRWKNMRNDKYNKNAKLDELADCFIVLTNIALFSGFDCEEIGQAILNKQAVVEQRIVKEKGGQ